MKHLFKVAAKWSKENKNLYATISKKYTKTHEIHIQGKELLQISAAKLFKGDPNLLNPEDLLLSSLVSCHLMSYLYVCAQNGIELISYEDCAEGDLELNSFGGGKFTEVRLHPKVEVASPEMVTKALALHQEANQLCFISNSCNFPVKHFPRCESI
ncbi:OsmC family protein [Pedobacter sp. MW01-1-1]|uniref:OsmC family protein n=1 Tax=Pedobacter sp. MW01-1-1 TaxID=3383027 RepID=UPI003FEE0206